MNRRVVGNVKVDFHLGRSLLASNLSKGHAGSCQIGASHECVEYEMTAFRSVFNPVFYKKGFCLLYKKELTLSSFSINVHLMLCFQNNMHSIVQYFLLNLNVLFFFHRKQHMEYYITVVTAT